MEEKIPAFVKKFDFRGVYGKDITDQDAYYLGLAVQKALPLKKVLIGWDTRVSSSVLAEHFMRSFVGTDVIISLVEKCPIDYITAASFSLDFDLSVMFTGSHNPWDWTGLLMHLKRGDSLQGEMVAAVVKNYFAVLEKQMPAEKISLEKYHDMTPEIEDLIAKKISTVIPLNDIKPLSVLVDIGDGSGEKGLHILERLLPQVSFTSINTRGVYDDASPHTADPSELKNMQDLITQVKEGKYDCGFAFDSDADRVLGVDEHGSYLNGSLFGSALIESLIQSGSQDVKIGYAVDCGPSFYNTLVQLQKNYRGLEIKTIPVGRSVLRKMVRDQEIDFGIENVGHFYMKDFFMTDSGVFSIALILFWISTHGPLSSLFSTNSDGQREQVFVPIPENQPQIMSQLEESFTQMYGESGLKKIEVDGLRYEMYTGKQMTSWFATRKSGYEPIQKFFFGSLVDSEFEKLGGIVKKLTS